MTNIFHKQKKKEKKKAGYQPNLMKLSNGHPSMRFEHLIIWIGSLERALKDNLFDVQSIIEKKG